MRFSNDSTRGSSSPPRLPSTREPLEPGWDSLWIKKNLEIRGRSRKRPWDTTNTSLICQVTYPCANLRRSCYVTRMRRRGYTIEESLKLNKQYRIYSFKRRPRLSAAYESKNIKERRPRISVALIHNNAALNRSTVRQNCSRSQTKKQLQYISILN